MKVLLIHITITWNKLRSAEMKNQYIFSLSFFLFFFSSMALVCTESVARSLYVQQPTHIQHSTEMYAVVLNVFAECFVGWIHERESRRLLYCIMLYLKFIHSQERKAKKSKIRVETLWRQRKKTNPFQLQNLAKLKWKLVSRFTQLSD